MADEQPEAQQQQQPEAKPDVQPKSPESEIPEIDELAEPPEESSGAEILTCAPSENELLKPSDLKYKADFWMAIESGEMAKSIAWRLRNFNNPRTVLTRATQEVFNFVNQLQTPAGEKKYRPNRKDIESFSRKFEKYYSEFHYLEKVDAFLKRFSKTNRDEQKFDKLNAYLWNAFFRVTDNGVEESFKQWMVNEKRMLYGLPVHYPILFGLWSPAGGNGKSFLLECLARALSDDHLFVLNQWSDLESTAGSYLKDVFGVLYKDEIGKTTGIKDTIKSLVTSPEVTIQCKYKEPIKLPKRFQLVCSANKPIGSRIFEDESGYQRRDGTHECYGRMFDVASKDDLILYFREMFELAPTEYKMDGVSNKTFELDEMSAELLRQLAESPVIIRDNQPGTRRKAPMQPFSKICGEVIGISKESDPDRYYRLEALLEKSGCFERIKYGTVSTRYFRAIPEKIAEMLDNTYIKDKLPQLVKEYVKPNVTKDFDQMYKEALAYKADESADYGIPDLDDKAFDRLTAVKRKFAKDKADESKPYKTTTGAAENDESLDKIVDYVMKL